MLTFLIGKPATGKTNYIVNQIVLNQYDVIFVVYLDLDVLEEYSDMDCFITNVLPKTEDFKSNLKYCLVLEDFHFNYIKNYSIDEITDYLLFLKQKPNVDIFIAVQDVEPTLELADKIKYFSVVYTANGKQIFCIRKKQKEINII